MGLVIDAGNTRIKWRFGGGAVESLVHRGQDDLRTVLRAAWDTRPQPAAIHVASVAGEGVSEAIRAAARDCWPELGVVFLASRAECCGVRVAYAQPGRFGVDRLAALVAARAREAARPVVVVDAGTAVTVDALDAEGRHLGGLIMPGLRLLFESLGAGTAEVGAPGAATWPEGGEGLQASTEAGVAAGARCMFVGGVLWAIDMALGVSGAKVYLTGGDAGILAAALGPEAVLLPDLVLEGVARMAEAG